MGQQETDSTVDGFLNDVREYVEKRAHLTTIIISERIALAASGAIQQFLAVMFMFGGLFFLWMALGFLLGEWLASNSLGFFLAALPLLIGGWILSSAKSKKLQSKIERDIYRQISVDLSSSGIDYDSPDEDSNSKSEETKERGGA
ncbi:MAG: phage holin family protein [Balneolaceae bacterium]